MDSGPPDSPQSPDTTESRRSSTANGPPTSSSLKDRLRRASVSFGQSELPGGFSAATGSIASSILTRQAVPRPDSPPIDSSADPSSSPVIPETSLSAGASSTTYNGGVKEKDETKAESPGTGESPPEPLAAAPFPNGYHFPPAHSAGHATKLGAIAFWKYFTTPLGFCVTIYGLNVVAWGGMLFLLLCNASPAMCHPTCNDIDSPRRKWIEWDSQILNALFCVTGFGLAPWRFRDLYFLLKYRIGHETVALRRLAGIHRGWFRLRGSTELPTNLGPRNVEEYAGSDQQADSLAIIPFPTNKIPNAPLTGVRARATALWKLDAVIWLMVWNTFLQCCLCGFMWSYNRYHRPSWSTGLFVALACIVAGVGGIMMFAEGKAVKGIEGVPVSEEDLERLERDREQGIFHYNNISDKDAEKKAKQKKAKEAKEQEREAQRQAKESQQ